MNTENIWSLFDREDCSHFVGSCARRAPNLCNTNLFLNNNVLKNLQATNVVQSPKFQACESIEGAPFSPKLH